ncbi:TetR/AcrR family transcriptional regulator [Actinophytocola oryzae]|uniref:TetR family transcriptional regulator n=1 Tax=Actinophytocola oryzae TaxID=502181 RepID=A0A4R7UT13_9PSEU|nr:TetR family transcriptional regulator [Actinophytocola oryzae]TDV39729.1 TetR family transcriptional regulator [Actinophytocola oryzae]
MEGGYPKGRIRREDILTAAVAVYGEAGYHGSSLREVAKRAGITHAGLLYYFPTKEALLAAVLERRDADDGVRLRLNAPPGRDVLRHWLALAEHNVANPGIVELYSRLAAEAVAPDHPAHDYFVRHYRIARRSAFETFRVLGERGELRTGVDARTAAVTFMALSDGLQVQWLTKPDEVDLVGVLRHYINTMLAEPI